LRTIAKYDIIKEKAENIMYLKKSKSKNGKIYLSIVHGYWDVKSKQSRTKTIKKLGYLDELKRQYADPIDHFKQVTEEMNKQASTEKALCKIQINPECKIEYDTRKNIGYAPLSMIYHGLELNTLFNNRSRNTKAEYSVNDIMKTEIFSRILFPGSKKSTYENRGLFFEKNQYSLIDVYRCLSFINTIREDIQLHIHERIVQKYGRTNELMYYDVTNYYFEIDEPDELRKKGVSKGHRPDPIVQMGLFMDSNGVPVTYQLFPGNTNDCETLIPLMKNVKQNYGIKKTIVVADKGINTQGNIVFNLLKGDGYVYSQTVRGGHKELKDYVLDSDDYREFGEDSKIKSRVYPREIVVTDIYGKKKKVRIDEKQIILYSKKYADRAKTEREAAILKAHDLVNDPAKYNRATSYGATKYVKNLKFDPDTGEVITTKSKLFFNEEKLREEEKWDGYYAIITSELDKTDKEIIEIYRGLWKIEESFKVTKSDLLTRPVYVTREDRIQAHFLICFIALTILRLLEKQLDYKFSASKIAESLSQVIGYPLEENWFVFGYVDDVTEEIQKVLGIPLTNKYMQLGIIKNIFANTKKY